MAGGGGGAWKVAYADFVTAMMAFFLVMWIVAQNKPALKEAIAGYFKDPKGSSDRPSGSPSIMPLRKDGDPMPAKTKGKERDAKGGEFPLKAPPNDDTKAITVKKPTILVARDGDEWSVGNVVAFGETSVELSDKAQSQLKALLPNLLGKPNRIELRGHATGKTLPADSPYKDAWELCYARCLATKKFLEANGVEPDRMRLSQASSFEPATRSLEADAQATNGRVEVHLLGEFVEAYKAPAKPPRKSKGLRPKAEAEEAKPEQPVKTEQPAKPEQH